MGRRNSSGALVLFGLIAMLVMAVISVVAAVLNAIMDAANTHPYWAVCIIVIPIALAILFSSKKAARKRKKQQEMEARYKAQVAAAFEKWKEWGQNGLPSITDEEMDFDGETLLLKAPYIWRVGASRQTHRGTLYATNTRFLLLSDTSTKSISYDNILMLTGNHEGLTILPKKKDKPIKIEPATDNEPKQRLIVADTYATWFLLNRGNFDKLELKACEILGVKKTVSQEEAVC